MEPDTRARLQEAHRLDRAGEHGRAVLAYKLLLKADPSCQEARVDLAGLLLVLGRHDEAAALCLEALEARPGDLRARQNLIGALLGLGRADEAEAHCRNVLAQAPTWTPARVGLALGFSFCGLHEEAERCLLEAQALDPGNPEVRSSLFQVQVKLRAWHRLRTTWEAIATRDLEGPAGLYEQAFLHLTYGELEEGWRLWEHRFTPPNTVAPDLAFPQPLWDGSPFPGRTLLLHYEQGMGDTLMFIRHARQAKARGGRVLALVQPPLLRVLEGCPGVDGLLTLEDPLPPFDLHLPLMSLPGILGIRLDNIPAEIPYLALPDAPSPAESLVRPSRNLKAGLVWAGNPSHRYDFMRTLPPSDLAPLAQVPGIDWYSLQVGYAGGLPWEGIVDAAPLLRDFADTARILSRLDLLVTVDTSAAHLAGALGLPVWVLLPLLPDWRWLLEGGRTPWYPTFRLFRQSSFNDWSAVMAEVAGALQALAAEPPP